MVHQRKQGIRKGALLSLCDHPRTLRKRRKKSKLCTHKTRLQVGKATLCLGSESLMVHQKIDKFELVDFFIQADRLGISSPHNVRCISSAPSGRHIITPGVHLPVDLMIYNSCGVGDIQFLTELMICTANAVITNQRRRADSAVKKQKPRTIARGFGAGDVTRTHDLLITNQLHYRLCYTSIFS